MAFSVKSAVGSLNPIIRSGLIAGAICGEVIVLIVLVNAILLRDLAAAAGSGPVLAGWNIVYPLLIILVFEIGGIFAAKLCKDSVKGLKDAIVTGSIAGVTIGIILEVMWFSNLVSLVVTNSVSLGLGGMLMVAGLLIVLVLMGGVLSAFGSYIYSIRNGSAIRGSAG